MTDEPGLNRPIRTPRDAEIAVAAWLDRLGERHVRLGPGVADSGKDVESETIVAQVKAGRTPTGRPVIQQIFGVATLEQKTAMVFSVAPYTTEAEEWAEAAGVALFRLEHRGRVRPVNRKAHRVMQQTTRGLTGWHGLEARLAVLAANNARVSATSTFRTPAGYMGFWGIWIDSGRIEVSRNLAGSGTRRVPDLRSAVRTVARQVRSVGAGFWDCHPIIEAEELPAPHRPTGSPRQRHHAADPVDTVTVSASDIYKIAGRPHCSRRLYLETHGFAGAGPTPLEEYLREQGQTVEQEHTRHLAGLVDLSAGSLQERFARTMTELNTPGQNLYQGVLLWHMPLPHTRQPVSLVGIPDFLLTTTRGALIRDTKIATSISDRKDIAAQLGFYGWLLQHVTRRPPLGLEVVAGDGQVHAIPPADHSRIIDWVDQVVRAKTATVEPACYPKWSDRTACPFFERCWSDAMSRSDPVTLPGVSRAIAASLREAGVSTIGDVTELDAGTLSGLTYQRAGRAVSVGKARAQTILRHARARSRGRVIHHGPVQLPASRHLALLDLEGVPPLAGQAGLIYLWGVMVMSQDGTVSDPYTPLIASQDSAEGFGKEAWHAFLTHAGKLLRTFGPDLPFLHWSHYEETQIEAHIAQYGDPDGIAEQVRQNLVDLLAVTRRGLTLPLPSYGLKTVEEFVGYSRTLAQGSGDWSIAIWNEAMASSDPRQRAHLLDQLAAYNEEDLLGLWAVYQWLRLVTGAAPG